MIGKLIVWALDWEGAVKKAKRALDEYCIEGVVTNIALHREIVKDDDFKNGTFDTGYLDKKIYTFNLNTMAENKSSFIASLIQKGLVTFRGDFI